MENIFDKLMEQRINVFKTNFIESSKELFFKDGKLIHPGEYGMAREKVCESFIKEFLPAIYDIGSGFIINSKGEVSTQCDLVIYDNEYTPLLRDGFNKKFFTAETCVAIGEVKSVLSKEKFKEALVKLAEICKLRDGEINSGYIRRHYSKETAYNPSKNPYDQWISFLICEKMDFSIENIENEIGEIYKEIEYCNRCNMILSLNDGLLTYYINSPEEAGKTITIQYPLGVDAKPLFITDPNGYIPCKLFMSYLYNSITKTTVLHPDLVNYIGNFDGEQLRFGK